MLHTGCVVAVNDMRALEAQKSRTNYRASSAICYLPPPSQVSRQGEETLESAPLPAADELECVLPNKLQLKSTNLLRR